MTYSEDVILKVWQKAQIDEYNIPNNFRKDNCGAWIERTEYENSNSAFGWNIDKINQELGSDDISNLYPVHSKNNVRNHDGTINCKVTSLGTTNVEKL
jgi:hypothetical protein